MSTTENKITLPKSIKQFLSTLSGLIVLLIIFAISNKNFFTTDNILNVIVQTTPILLIAIGQTYVLITGGIDLSIGSNIAISGVVTAMLMKSGLPIFLSIIIGLLSATTVGVANGALVTYGKLPPFIVTLGTMTAVRGITLTLTKGIPISGLPDGFNAIGIEKTFGIPNPIYIMIFFVIIFGLILAKTKTGRYTYALGSNFEASRLSGVNVHSSLIKVYAFSGLLSGVAGLVMAARIISAPPTAGMGYELNAVAASVIGGASTLGGEGTIAGTAVGALIIGILSNGLNLMGVSPFIQQIVTGIVIIGAVFADKIRHND
ncbi:ribose ABC transporter permease [Vallitalea longa]|uniref:Ribose ABC transporter permease n=1 Tax=Vallitalea longa TaxID=2936439 RepID=A0A9W5YDL9_9FIRM|nr:ABC transporter permease [Vallitalea longa]GKX31557.1 ribose ABC transporter permease [Vallitalea longa]